MKHHFVFSCVLYALLITKSIAWSAGVDSPQFLDPSALQGMGTTLGAISPNGKEACSLALAPLSTQRMLPDEIDALELVQYSREILFQEVLGMVQYGSKGHYQPETHFDLIESILRKGNVSPWQFIVIPDQKVRSLAFHFAMGRFPGVDANQWLSQPFKGHLQGVQLDQWKSEVQKSIESILSTAISSRTDYSLSDLQARILCGSYDLMTIGKCQKALLEILNSMRPKSVVIKPLAHSTISMPELYKKILVEPDYYESARIVGQKIKKMIDSGELPTSNLFEDLVEVFIGLGRSKAQAIEMTWDLIGLYSTRGANLGETIEGFLPESMSAYALYFDALSIGVGVLDSRAVEHGFSYSLPKKVKNSLDTGKPYHFWMSAYLAREMLLLTKNVKAARSATWIVQIGYQMRSKTLGRDPNRAFMVECFDQGNQKIRMDLAYASAGIDFGIDSKEVLSTRSYDIDDRFKTLLKKATPLKPMDLNEIGDLWNKKMGVEAYFRWKKIFNPDAIF